MLAAPMSFVITSVIIETHASALSSYCAPQQVTPLSPRPVEVEALWGGEVEGADAVSGEIAVVRHTSRARDVDKNRLA